MYTKKVLFEEEGSSGFRLYSSKSKAVTVAEEGLYHKAIFKDVSAKGVEKC